MFQPALYNCTRFERGFWGFAISRHCWRSNKTLLWCNTIDSSVKEATNTGSQTHPYSIAISIKQIADNKLVTSIQAWRTMKSVSTSWDYVYISILEQRVKDNHWKHMVLLECYHHWMNFLFCHLRLGLMEQDWALHFCISTYCSRICITWINAMYFKKLTFGHQESRLTPWCLLPLRSNLPNDTSCYWCHWDLHWAAIQSSSSATEIHFLQEP